MSEMTASSQRSDRAKVTVLLFLATIFSRSGRWRRFSTICTRRMVLLLMGEVNIGGGHLTWRCRWRTIIWFWASAVKFKTIPSYESFEIWNVGFAPVDKRSAGLKRNERKFSWLGGFSLNRSGRMMHCQSFPLIMATKMLAAWFAAAVDAIWVSHGVAIVMTTNLYRTISESTCSTMKGSIEWSWHFRLYALDFHVSYPPCCKARVSLYCKIHVLISLTTCHGASTPVLYRSSLNSSMRGHYIRWIQAIAQLKFPWVHTPRVLCPIEAPDSKGFQPIP